MSLAIKTPAQLDALPAGSVIITRRGTAFQKIPDVGPVPWRSTKLHLSSDGLMLPELQPITLVYDPGVSVNAKDARPQALVVAQEMLAAELGSHDDLYGIARRLIEALAGDGLIHYSPTTWDFAPGCSLRVHGPGRLTAADLDAAPPRSVVVTEDEDIWQKERDGFWQWQSDQVYGEPMLDLDSREEPKTNERLAQVGPLVLVTTGWEE